MVIAINTKVIDIGHRIYEGNKLNREYTMPISPKKSSNEGIKYERIFEQIEKI